MTNYADQVLADNPVAYYRMAESSGTVAVDETGNHDGTYTGGVTLGGSGPCAGALAAQFDGTTGYINVPNHADLQITGDMTIVVMLYAEAPSFGFRSILGKNTGNKPAPYDFYTNDLTPTIVRGDGSSFASAVADSAFSGATWHRLMMRHEGTTVTFRLNGVQLGAQKTLSVTTGDDGTDLKVASRDDLAIFWHGFQAHLAIYDYALTDGQDDAQQALIDTCDEGPTPPPEPPPPVVITYDPVDVNAPRTGKLLGCGFPSAYLTRVGGGKRLATLDFTNLSYSRRLSEIGDYRLDLSSEQDAICQRFLSDLEPWLYEVSIYRDATESAVGPLIEPVYTYDGATIGGRDLFVWYERRWHTVDRAFVQTDLSTIAALYLQDGLLLDDSPNISFQVNLSGILVDRQINASLYPRVADSVRELSRSGLDFVTILREIILSGEREEPPVLNLTEDIFEVSSARLSGNDVGNEWVILGAQPAGVTTPLVGHAGGKDLPLVQQVLQDPAILDVPSANSAAESRWSFTHVANAYVSGVLKENAPIAFEDLIPGIRMRLIQQIGFRMFDVIVRLISVDVSIQATETGYTESVSLTLVPIGSS